MPDDLRTRIAAVLDRHYFGHPESQPPTQVSLAGADAVICELGWRQEESWGTNVPVEDRRLTRWVTEWIADA